MSQVAVVSIGALAVVTAVSVVMQNSRWQAAGLEQSRVQHEELVHRLDRLEQAIAAAQGRGSSRADASRVAPSGAPTSHELAVSGDSPKDLASEAAVAKDPDHAQRLQNASALLDRGIQMGQWSRADMAALGAATNGLTAEERDQLMSRLTVAINSDQIRLDMRRQGGP